MVSFGVVLLGVLGSLRSFLKCSDRILISENPVRECRSVILDFRTSDVKMQVFRFARY